MATVLHQADGRDPHTALTLFYTLRRRRSVPVDHFYAYWRDVHVQVACRLPGIHSLWTHWVSYDEGDLWPRVPGVDWWLPEELRFDGIPEPTFLTDEDVGRFIANVGPLIQDDPVIFEETVGYSSLGDGSSTVVDRLADPAPCGDQGVLRLMVFLQRSDNVAPDRFHSWVADEFAPGLAFDPSILKVRRHLFEPYEDPGEVADHSARSLSHRKAPEHQYHAALEVVLPDRLALTRLPVGDAWRSTIAGQQEMLRRAHAFHASRTYCMRFNGELTTAGLRTAGVAELIKKLGAGNQLTPEVSHLVETGRPLGG
ncbi:hypothetical protein [Amycolatopsis sp. NPDC049868]|uniref:hypothetical protein n=1 Tax=Amycolatopsis sp. NPDC049868 TaxID=3363934 RepID=UPI00378BC1B7